MSTPFAYRLKSARLHKGVTQQQLADVLGISKQAVSQYENGNKKPNSAILIALSRYFDKPAGLFFRPVVAPLEKVDFRKRSSLKGRKLEAVKCAVQDRLEPYLELENILNLNSELSNPIEGITVERPETAEIAALEVMKTWELGLNPIPNVLEMLEDHGIKVVDVSLDPEFDGLSTWVNGAIPVIVLNREMETVRKRFTALHELGHLLLVFPENASLKLKETACNRFAGAMLLPEKILKQAIGAHRHHIAFDELIQVKEYFGISLAAIMYRCKDFGIFPEQVLERFWKKRKQDQNLMLEKGYRIYQGSERAFRFETLIYKALAENIISISKAAALSGKTLDEVQEQFKMI